MGAAGTRQLALRPVHEAVQDERVVRAEQLRHLHLLGHAGLADPLEDVVLGHLAAGRQRAAFRRNSFDLGPQRNLFIQQRVSCGAILRAFIGIMQMFHGSPLDAGRIERCKMDMRLTHPREAGSPYSSTAIALISIRYSGEVILVISTMVEAGVGLEYLAPDFVDLLEVLHVAHVDVDPADIVHGAAGGLDRRLDVQAGADKSAPRCRRCRRCCSPAAVPSCRG